MVFKIHSLLWLYINNHSIDLLETFSKVSNKLILRISSLNVLLNRSMYPFWVGLPGSMYFNSYSSGLLLHSINSSNFSITFLLEIDNEGKIINPSRLKSSIILSVLNLRPELRLSEMKSIDQWIFGRSGCIKTSFWP